MISLVCLREIREKMICYSNDVSVQLTVHRTSAVIYISIMHQFFFVFVHLQIMSLFVFFICISLCMEFYCKYTAVCINECISVSFLAQSSVLHFGPCDATVWICVLM